MKASSHLFIVAIGCVKMIGDDGLYLSAHPFAGLTESRERGTQIIIPGNVAVKDGAIMLCHLERGMSEQVLKCKSVAAAVHQIFPGKCMAEHMNTCFQNAALMVIVRDSQFQGVL